LLTISRQLAKQIRSVIRRALQISPSQTGQIVWLISDDTGLRIRAQNHHGIVEFHQPGSAAADTVPISLEALAMCEGTRADETVSIERRPDGHIILRWDDRGVAQQFSFDAKNLNPDPPPLLPASWGSNPPSLLGALDIAMRMTATNPTRNAIDCVQLRPVEGRIAATDSRQMLVQTGFSFPWQHDVLVQRSPAFRCRELASDQPVEVGVTDKHFVVRSGAWTVWLALEKHGRFPEIGQVIPAVDSAKTRLRLTDSDVEYLLNVIPRLPQEQPDNPRVTLDLNGRIALLARGAEPSPVTQVILSNSTRQGEEARLDTDREFLARAAELGFREFELREPDSPIVCRDERRTYLWTPIIEVPAIVVGPDAVRLESPISANATHRPTRHLPPPRRPHSSNQERTTSRMSHNRIAATLSGSPPPSSNGSVSASVEPTEAGDQSTSFVSVLREAEAVKTSLRAAHSQVSRLIVALKRHRRQTKLMQTTLASLRQLQSLEV
jgi:hypothetical protein